jgi:hypothetical protein
MSVDMRRFLFTAVCSASGAAFALIAAATASADPVLPVPPPPPNVAPAPVAPAPVPLVPLTAVTAPAPGPDAAGQLPSPSDGVPHLASPDALPPGSTMDPQDTDSPNVSYLKDLWQAVQNQEISGKEALLLGIAQRGMNTPYPDQAPGPNVPVSSADPAAPPPPPPAPALPWLPPPSG